MQTCSLCQGFIPQQISQCPHCDAQVAQPKKGLVKTIVGALSGGALSVTLMACYGVPPAVCGDSNAEIGWSTEECDDGNTVGGDGCSFDCQIEDGCGDGNPDPQESCDDDNVLKGDGCSSQCAKEPGFVCTGESPSVCDYICGDGILIAYVTVDFLFSDPAEGCDDGNTEGGDGCSPECQIEVCGDGVNNNNGQEECDNGTDNSDINAGACRTNCRNARCGDLVIDPGEVCDNGLANGTEGSSNPNNCRVDCSLPACGDGIVDPGEQCDDGNQDATDSCRNNCTPN